MRSPTDWLSLIARFGLGVVFFVFGLNGFLHFVPLPEYPAEALAFLGALNSAGYVMPIVKGIETLGGLLLLSGRAVPLALVLLAPIVVNIVGFHLVLAPYGTGLGLFVLFGTLFLAWTHRHSYAPLFRSGTRVRNEGARVASPSASA